MDKETRETYVISARFEIEAKSEDEAAEKAWQVLRSVVGVTRWNG